MTDLGVAVLCVVIFLLMLAMCALAHSLDEADKLRQRLKELEQ